MRIECDNCSAKYSIADEKVIGKLFKVRCKKCANMIMVDGTTLGGNEEPEEATRVFDTSAAQSDAEASMATAGAATATAAAVWYVVIDGQQTGPLTFAEVQGHAASGAVDAQTFAWREGMDDWFPIADIPDLAAATRAPAPAPVVAAAPAPEPEPEDEFDDEATRVVSTSDDEGAFSFGGITGGQSAIDSFSAPAPAPAPAPATAAAPSGGDMFAGVASGSASVAPAASPSQPAASGGSMVGERNESSVLFSLSDLTSSRSSQPKQDELPRTEGSGLIDIRVLAQAQSQVADPGAAAAPPSASAAVPVTPLVPVAPRRRNTGLMVGIGVGVVVLLGLVVALVVLLLQDEPTPAPVVVADSTPSDEDGADEGSAEEAGAVAAADPAGDAEGSGDAVAAAADGSGEGSGDAVAMAEGSGDAVEGDGEGEGDGDGEGETVVAAATNTNTNTNSGSTDDTPSRPSTTTTTPSRPSSTDRTPPARDTTEDRPRGDDAVNSALSAIRGGSDRGSDSGTTSGSTGSTGSSEPAAAAGPTELSRSQVQSTVRRYRSRLESCRTDGGDRAQYDFRWVIQPNGAVTNAQARQSDDVAQCALGVIRAMQFPRFNGDAQRIPAYPMQL